MKIIITPHQGWHSQGGARPIDLPVNPDKIVCDIVESNLSVFDENKTFVKLWFSKLYHDSNNNLSFVQEVISKITEHNSRSDLVFLCGHIIANMLDFGQNKVLTYHGSRYNDHTVTIPMPAFNFCKTPKDLKQRIIKASFAGSFDTHWTRRHMWYSLLNRDDCTIKDTGLWHYYKDKKSQSPEFSNFKDLLSNSVMTLSPRGTGPCTIRLWESLESHSIPVIISDEYKDPYIENFRLSDMCLRIRECDAQNVANIIDSIDPLELLKKFNMIQEYTKVSYKHRVLETIKKELVK
jgi:hypothetical protein